MLRFVELGKTLLLNCEKDFVGDWIFHPYDSRDVHPTAKKLGKHKDLIHRNVDYYNSGNYFCHGSTFPHVGDYILYRFSVIVYGMNIIFLKYFM